MIISRSMFFTKNCTEANMKVVLNDISGWNLVFGSPDYVGVFNDNCTGMLKEYIDDFPWSSDKVDAELIKYKAHTILLRHTRDLVYPHSNSRWLTCAVVDYYAQLLKDVVAPQLNFITFPHHFLFNLVRLPRGAGSLSLDNKWPKKQFYSHFNVRKYSNGRNLVEQDFLFFNVQQKDNYNCGVYMLAFMECVLSGTSFDYVTKEKMETFRKVIYLTMFTKQQVHKYSS